MLVPKVTRTHTFTIRHTAGVGSIRRGSLVGGPPRIGASTGECISDGIRTLGMVAPFTAVVLHIEVASTGEVFTARLAAGFEAVVSEAAVSEVVAGAVIGSGRCLGT